MMTDEQSTRVLIWWAALSVVAVLNICLWLRQAGRQARGAVVGSGGRVAGTGRLHLVLSAVFVFGCAFRSFLPRAEGQRICLYDSRLSSAMAGRWVATFAELCLVAQLALVLHGYGQKAGARGAILVSRVMLPLIMVAELFSWYTTLTTNFMGSVVEESLWASMATLQAAAFVLVWWRWRSRRPKILGAAILLNVAYIIFMFSVDVPMYWARWKADERAHKQYLSLSDGWGDARDRRVVTRRWADWRDEVPWMSLYFSAGVWVSLAMVSMAHGTRKEDAPEGRGLLMG